MKVTQETITVLSDPAAQEVSVLMAGLRLTFSVDEAQQLADGIEKAMAELNGPDGKRSGVPALAAMVGGSKTEEPGTVSLMITQAQRSALRQKGHSDEAIRNMKPAEAHRLLGLTSKTG